MRYCCWLPAKEQTVLRRFLLHQIHSKAKAINRNHLLQNKKVTLILFSTVKWKMTVCSCKRRCTSVHFAHDVTGRYQSARRGYGSRYRLVTETGYRYRYDDPMDQHLSAAKRCACVSGVSEAQAAGQKIAKCSAGTGVQSDEQKSRTCVGLRLFLLRFLLRKFLQRFA